MRYAKAGQVIAWLGDASVDSDAALQLVSTLHSISLHLSSSSDEEARAALLKPSPNAYRAALCMLMEMQWFNRIWVMQEAILAKQCLVVCGNNTIPWESLEGLLVTLQRYGLLNQFHMGAAARRTLAISISPALFLMTKYKSRRRRGEPLRILDALNWGRYCDCTDPRDKVFALLGIVSDADEAAFDPDYLASTETIYCRIAVHILRRDRVPEMLHSAGVGHPRNHPRLPTWVPDWSVSSSSVLADLATKVGFAAAGNTAPVFGDVSSDTISFKGRVLDTVHSILPPDPAILPHILNGHRHIEYQAMIDFHEEAARLFVKLHPYPTAEAWSDVFWRTLQANTSSQLLPARIATAEARGDLIVWLENLKNIAQACHPGFQNAPLLRNLLTEVPLYLSAAVNRASLYVTSRAPLRPLRVFSTQGGYAGLAPPLAEPNDVVGLLYGAKTPFVLRPTPKDGVWQFVGDCYVHGLMQGEAMDMGTEEMICLI